MREIIKTAIENGQNLIVEGCYIPFSYKEVFSPEYLENIKFICLVFSGAYIENNYHNIIERASVIEKRLEDYVPKETLIAENASNLDLCRKHGLDYILIEDDFDWDEPEILVH